MLRCLSQAHYSPAHYFHSSFFLSEVSRISVNGFITTLPESFQLLFFIIIYISARLSYSTYLNQRHLSGVNINMGNSKFRFSHKAAAVLEIYI